MVRESLDGPDLKLTRLFPFQVCWSQFSAICSRIPRIERGDRKIPCHSILTYLLPEPSCWAEEGQHHLPQAPKEYLDSALVEAELLVQGEEDYFFEWSS